VSPLECLILWTLPVVVSQLVGEFSLSLATMCPSGLYTMRAFPPHFGVGPLQREAFGKETHQRVCAPGHENILLKLCTVCILTEPPRKISSVAPLIKVSGPLFQPFPILQGSNPFNTHLSPWAKKNPKI